MATQVLIDGLAGIVFMAAPLVIAAIGETLAERAGVINLSLNGTIILSAMAGFAAASRSGSVTLGFLAGAAVGAAIALLVAFCSITLRLSQVAVGFVLAFTCRDLAYFLGAPFMDRSAPRLSHCPVPGLSQLPVLGPVLFSQDWMTYGSFGLAIAAWVWLYRSRPGLVLRAVGEHPEAAFARGISVPRCRYAYTLIGGALAGLAGPVFSLSVKAGWKGSISGLDGMGWIVLAITIFGGWNPVRAAAGAYLFALIHWLGLVLQPVLPDLPAQVFQVSPFPLMILTLLLVSLGQTEWVDRALAALPGPARSIVGRLLQALHSSPPAALGRPFSPP